MSFKEFIYPLTFWYYDKDMPLTDRVLSFFLDYPVASYSSCASSL